MVLSLRVHFAQTLSAGNVLYQKHYTCTPESAGIVHLDATAQSTECHMTRFEPIRLQNILGSCITPPFPLDKPTETRHTLIFSYVRVFIDCQHGCNYINGKSMLRRPQLFQSCATESFTVKFICHLSNKKVKYQPSQVSCN